MSKEANRTGSTRLRFSVLVVSLMTLAACAKGTTLQSGSASRDSSAVQGRLTALVQQIEGTREDRLAGLLISYHSLQDGLVECMAKGGFEYVAPPFVDETIALRNPIIEHSEWLDPLTDDFGLPWFARAMTIVNAAQAKSDATESPYYSMSESKQAAFDGALGECAGGMPSVEGLDFPQGFAQLDGALMGLLESVSKELESYRPAYVECMAARGGKIENDNYLDTFDQLVYGMPPYPVAADTDGIERWNDWMSAVTSNAEADRACRRDAYDAGMALLGPQLEQFELDHKDQIDLVVQEWTQMVDTASTYPEFARSLIDDRPSWPGWDGSAPAP